MDAIRAIEIINELNNLYKDELELLEQVFSKDDGIDFMIENLGVFNEGVYCGWNDCLFSDIDFAVECMKEDDNAIDAAFRGCIEIENRPYIENMYNGCQKLIYSSRYSFDNCLILLEELEDINDGLLDINIISVIVDKNSLIAGFESVLLKEELLDAIEESESNKTRSL